MRHPLEATKSVPPGRRQTCRPGLALTWNDRISLSSREAGNSAWPSSDLLKEEAEQSVEMQTNNSCRSCPDDRRGRHRFCPIWCRPWGREQEENGPWGPLPAEQPPYAAACCAMPWRPAATRRSSLMRSCCKRLRQGPTDYLLAAWHPDTRPATLDLAPAGHPDGSGLEVRRRYSGMRTMPRIEFVARYRIARRGHRLRETRPFLKIAGVGSTSTVTSRDDPACCLGIFTAHRGLRGRSWNIGVAALHRVLTSNRFLSCSPCLNSESRSCRLSSRRRSPTGAICQSWPPTGLVGSASPSCSAVSLNLGGNSVKGWTPRIRVRLGQPSPPGLDKVGAARQTGNWPCFSSRTPGRGDQKRSFEWTQFGCRRDALPGFLGALFFLCLRTSAAISG